MQSKVFKQGNYIWECKSSHDLSGEIDLTYLKSAIKEVEKRWEREGKPSGYNYVFPINLITNTARQELERFKNAYRGQVDINYYDREQVQKLIQGFSKMSDMESFVNYIKQVWKG
ncbi:hypothetical protein [Dolichospermum circinale]|jgi:hypothetical protein|uniref:hypothetical protein n=1 Tax=Dolichospermum circinale TaxID=109265 RepID=UPI00232F126A|nr:hypothetical protein [Dolichospermum circinale]MDB9451771.1 hypothetical protein [Dolichospermum circinale CS-547]